MPNDHMSDANEGLQLALANNSGASHRVVPMTLSCTPPAVLAVVVVDDDDVCDFNVASPKSHHIA